MKILSTMMMLLILTAGFTDAIRVPGFLQGIFGSVWTQTSPTETLSDGLATEDPTSHLIVGTKAELVELKKLLEETRMLPEHALDFNTNVPDDYMMSLPFALSEIARHPPVSVATPAQGNVKNGSCEVAIEDMLPLLRNHPLPTIVHDNSEMIIRMMQSLVPKPETFEARLDAELPPSASKLISFAVRNSGWVRASIAEDPAILTDLLGFSSSIGPAVANSAKSSA